MDLSDCEELRFEVNGHLIAARSWGDVSGIPVLALHGWLDNAATFNRLAPSLKGVRLVALDLMGHGYSDHRPSSMPYYIWDNVADVLGVADQLGWHKFNLLGHSMGASISTLLAGAFSDRVSGMILIEGIAPLVTEPDQTPKQLAQAITKRRRVQGRAQKSYLTFDDAVAARMNGRWPVDVEAAHWLVERSLVKRDGGFFWSSDPSLALPSMMRITEAQAEGFIKEVMAPVLLILADKGIPQSDRRISLFRKIDKHVIPGGHHLHLELDAATKIAMLINNWISE